MLQLFLPWNLVKNCNFGHELRNQSLWRSRFLSKWCRHFYFFFYLWGIRDIFILFYFAYGLVSYFLEPVARLPPLEEQTIWSTVAAAWSMLSPRRCWSWGVGNMWEILHHSARPNDISCLVMVHTRKFSIDSELSTSARWPLDHRLVWTTKGLEWIQELFNIRRMYNAEVTNHMVVTDSHREMAS